MVSTSVATLRHCNRCGKVIGTDKRKRCCPECQLSVNKENNRKRGKRYREAHREELRVAMINYRKEHHDQILLNARNYIHRHPELIRQRLTSWRLHNPTKRALQNKRAHRRDKHRKYKREKASKERELNRELTRQFKLEHPTYQYDYYRNTHEVIVASTCKVCGTIIPYKCIGKIPQKCGNCKCIERSRLKPLWNPTDTLKFIRVERSRLGLDSWKKWTISEILLLYEKYPPIDYSNIGTWSDEEYRGYEPWKD